MTLRSVLFLVPDLWGPPGGIARHGRMVCRALVDRNVELAVLALLDTNDADGRAEGLALDYHACRGRRVTFIWRALFALRKRPDLILVEHPHFSPLGWLCARLLRVPFVIFAHGTDIWEPLPRSYRWALQRADLVICVSHFTAGRAISANGLSPDIVRVLHHGLDPTFPVSTSQTEASEKCTLLTVARIRASEGYKGHDLVIQTLPVLLQEFPDLVYDIAGDGDGRPTLERLTTHLGVRSAVRFHGVVSEEELSKLYAGASLVVMPSRGEGFGLVFLEAMVHGKPVIAGNGDAASEVVRHGETGLLVDPSDRGSLTESIRRLLADSALRHDMGSRGAARVAEQFSYTSFRLRLWGLLDEVVNGGDGPRSATS